MNGRAIVHNTLANYPPLAGIEVMPNFGFDDPPRGPFITVRWGPSPLRRAVGREVREFSVWAHIPVSVSRDFDEVDAILRHVRTALEGVEQESSFGESVTCISYTGTGPDFEDPGYNTITRNAGFEILAR